MEAGDIETRENVKNGNREREREREEKKDRERVDVMLQIVAF